MRPIFWRIVKKFRARDVVERVAEFFPRRHIGLAEPGKIRRDYMKPVREKRDQVQEHVARAREAVQEQQLRRMVFPSSIPRRSMDTVCRSTDLDTSFATRCVRNL